MAKKVLLLIQLSVPHLSKIVASIVFTPSLIVAPIISPVSSPDRVGAHKNSYHGFAFPLRSLVDLSSALANSHSGRYCE